MRNGAGSGRELDQELTKFLNSMALREDVGAMRADSEVLMRKLPPEREVEVAAAMTWYNPFYRPDMTKTAASRLNLSPTVLAEVMLRGKLTAAHGERPNILLACQPKSASTFLQAAIGKALGVPAVALHAATVNGYSASKLGANLREQEPEEMALLRHGISGKGYIAQQHARCSPYLSRLLETYSVKPIVSHRNIFDTIVSLDDMVMEWRDSGIGSYFDDGMPANFSSLERDDRLMLLAQRHTAWFLQFYVSWVQCRNHKLVDPLFISYETDFLGDKAVLARRIGDYLGCSDEQVNSLAGALDDRRAAPTLRFNKGIADRGRDMPAAVRAHVLDYARYYRDDIDLTPLMGADFA